MTFTGSPTSQSGAVLTVEKPRFHTVASTDYVEVIIRNSGTADAKIDAVYAGTSDSAMTLQSSVSYSPSSQIVTAGSSLNVTITYNWTDGTKYYFKMATKEGFTLTFNADA